MMPSRTWNMPSMTSPRAGSMRTMSDGPQSDGAATRKTLAVAAWSAPMAVKAARNEGPNRPRRVTWYDDPTASARRVIMAPLVRLGDRCRLADPSNLDVLDAEGPQSRQQTVQGGLVGDPVQDRADPVWCRCHRAHVCEILLGQGSCHPDLVHALVHRATPFKVGEPTLAKPCGQDVIPQG